MRAEWPAYPEHVSRALGAELEAQLGLLRGRTGGLFHPPACVNRVVDGADEELEGNQGHVEGKAREVVHPGTVGAAGRRQVHEVELNEAEDRREIFENFRPGHIVQEVRAQNLQEVHHDFDGRRGRDEVEPRELETHTHKVIYQREKKKGNQLVSLSLLHFPVIWSRLSTFLWSFSVLRENGQREGERVLRVEITTHRKMAQ